VKVSGDLVEGSIKKGAVGEPITFQIHDKDSPDKVLFVTHTGPVPDTFREPLPEEPAPEVVITGDYLQNKEFSSVDLLAKCPSKYEAKAAEEAKTGTTATP
jgi:cytochrome c-type biogenesis protein CcmE